jgi:outer membrane immunogenic protein
MRRLLLASVALASFISGSAQAADVWAPPPVYQVANPAVYQVAARWPGLFSWSGFYVGGHAGWGWGSFEATNLGLASPYQVDVTGGVAGGQVGFNWQLAALVVGVEADFSAKGFHGSDDGAIATTDELRGRWGGTARVRLGYALDRWMFYATGGWASLNYRYNVTPVLPSYPGLVSSTTDSGWVVGAGVEQSFAPNWSAKIEYLHAEYGNLDLATDEVRVGLNYKWVASY